MIPVLIGGVALAIWLYLALVRGLFWRTRPRDSDLFAETALPEAGTWPSVVAVVPARNEAEVIRASVGALLAQRYPGDFDIIVVDDQSSDDTAALAGRAATLRGRGGALTVLRGTPLLPGWAGKLWAMEQGVAAIERRPNPPDYLLFTDADIACSPDLLAGLVTAAERRGAVLVSLMAKLRCESIAERLLIPAFVFFFQKLYPFAWVNDPKSATAAAAGGCMLVRRAALQRAGGLTRIRSAIIDDCALGALMKQHGPIWLGLATEVHSLRPYPQFADIRRMVARSAYAQLGYSPWRLVGAVIGMGLTYAAAPALVIFGHGPARLLGGGAWLLMTLAYMPMLRFYGRSRLWAPLLPAVAVIYTAYTIASAAEHARGRGGAWKGRYQAASQGSHAR
jgi:hopene-associated glycosyltransferase HpnB